MTCRSIARGFSAAFPLLFVSATQLGCTTGSSAELLVNGDVYKSVDGSDPFRDVAGLAAKKTLIVFIHGRGDYPEKLTKNLESYDLKHEYDAALITFHWSPSDTGYFGFPQEHARAAGSAFAEFLKRLSDARVRGIIPADVKMTLLCHSMGTFVLQNFAEEYASLAEIPKITSLFDTIVINSAAVPSAGHAEWLSRLGGSVETRRKIYVTINSNDWILWYAGAFRGLRLGRGLVNTAEGRPEAADGVTYLDISEADVNHHTYVSSGQNGHPALRAFYGNVLTGRPAELGGFVAETATPNLLKLLPGKS